MFRSRSTGGYISDTGGCHAALYGGTEGTSSALRLHVDFETFQTPDDSGVYRSIGTQLLSDYVNRYYFHAIFVCRKV